MANLILWNATPKPSPNPYLLSHSLLRSTRSYRTGSVLVKTRTVGHDFYFLYSVMYSGVECVCGVTPSIYPHRAS